MKNNKQNPTVVEFDINDILPTVLILGVATLGTAFILQMLGDTRDDYVDGTAGCNSTVTSSCGAEYNATVEGIEGLAKIPEKMGLIASAVVFGILIGILVRYLMTRMG